MSAGTIERERGDDRNPDVSVERLNEMFSQPDAVEPIYVSDMPQGAIGEFAPVSVENEKFRHSTRHPRHLGHITLRRAHITRSTQARPRHP